MSTKNDKNMPFAAFAALRLEELATAAKVEGAKTTEVLQNLYYLQSELEAVAEAELIGKVEAWINSVPDFKAAYQAASSRQIVGKTEIRLSKTLPSDDVQAACRAALRKDQNTILILEVTGGYKKVATMPDNPQPYARLLDKMTDEQRKRFEAARVRYRTLDGHRLAFTSEADKEITFLD